MKLSPLYCLTLLLAAMFIGCAAVHPSQTSETGNAISRIDARAQSIGDNAQRLRPLTQSEGLPILDAVGTDAGRIRQDVVEAKHANDQAAADYAAMAQRYDRVYHSIGYTAQRWIVGVSIVAGLAWVAVGLFGALATSLGGGIWFSAGKLALNLLPFSNPWSAMSRKIEAREGV
jgi:hypothetical protein